MCWKRKIGIKEFLPRTIFDGIVCFAVLICITIISLVILPFLMLDRKFREYIENDHSNDPEWGGK